MNTLNINELIQLIHKLLKYLKLPQNDPLPYDNNFASLLESYIQSMVDAARINIIDQIQTNTGQSSKTDACDFESIETLNPTLAPILEREVAARFLPWMEANHRAWHSGEKETSLTMNGSLFQQKTFKYQALTLDELRSRFAAVSDHENLLELLEETGCLPFFSVEQDTSDKA